jgi:hypothetical protein
MFPVTVEKITRMGGISRPNARAIKTPTGATTTTTPNRRRNTKSIDASPITVGKKTNDRKWKPKRPRPNLKKPILK